jgi:hypothetical protein
MATTTDPLFTGSTGRTTRGLLRITILCLIAAAAVASRLFSVIRTYTSSLPELLQPFISPEMALAVLPLPENQLLLYLLWCPS